MNAGLTIDAPFVHETGAGHRPLRTELHSCWPALPAHEEQYQFTRPSLTPFRQTRHFRTLDIGSDKVLPTWPRSRGEPGARLAAIRIGLDRPGLLRLQLRAMLKASAGAICASVPMIANVADSISPRRSPCGKWSDPPHEHGMRRSSNSRHGGGAALLWELDQIAGVRFSVVGSNDSCNIFTPPTATIRASPALRQSLDASAARLKASSTPATARARR